MDIQWLSFTDDALTQSDADAQSLNTSAIQKRIDKPQVFLQNWHYCSDIVSNDCVPISGRELLGSNLDVPNRMVERLTMDAPLEFQID